MLTDEELMRAYVAGDRMAFRELFERYAPALLRMARRDLRQPEDAHDLVQQTFLQLHRARADFREGARVRPWVFTIAMNLKRQYFRTKGRRPEAPLVLEGADDPKATTGDPETPLIVSSVRRAVEELPAAQREVIELHWFEDLPFAEVAEVLGASQSAVKVRAHRGYQRLKARLGGDSDVTDASLRVYANWRSES